MSNRNETTQDPELVKLRARVAAISSVPRFNAFNPQDWKQLATDTQASVMQANSRPAIEAWLEEDARTHLMDDGTTACGRYYQHLKHETQKSLQDMVTPVRMMVQSMLMHNASVQELMRSDVMSKQFQFVDSVIRERYPDESGVLYSPQYNHKFLTEDSTGKIVDMNEEAIVALFHKRGEGEVFPHIILTSSHAQGETLNDVTSITHGIEALARDSEGKPLPHGHKDTGVKAGQTLTLFACDVEKSPLLNGAKLLDRINELKRIERTGKVETDYNDISPGAKRIAKLMLKCMIEDPKVAAEFRTDEARCMSDLGIQNEKPIRLRADAVEIAHHFQLIGYSKGGNVVSDAMRYLVGELTAKNGEGKDIFEIHPDSPERNGDGTNMSTRNVSKIVRNIAVMALASVEVGMSDYYKQHGVRRVAINSDKDLISAHSNYDGSVYDERWIIRGVERNVGHAPQDMMGMRAGATTFTHENPGAEIKGYAHDDPRVARRLKEFFAPNYGKAAIGRVTFNGHAKEGEVTIEAATGTTDRQIEAFKDTIENVVAKTLKLRPSDVQLTSDPSLPGIFALKCKGVDFSRSADALKGLDRAFGIMRSSPDVKGLLITQSILDAGGDIDKQIKAVNTRGRW